MSFWQWSAAINGYIAAHSPKQNTLSEAERDELYEWLDRDAIPAVLSTMTYRLDEAARLVPAGTVAFTAPL